MHPFRKLLWVGLLSAMMPVTFVSGMPQLGCICADGHFKPFCERLLNFGSVNEAQSRSNLRPCCCHQEKGVEHQRTTGDGRLCCRAQTCCKPLIGSPLVAPGKQRIVAPGLMGLSSLVPVVDSLVPLPVATGSDNATRSAALPVPDLIIAHQALVI